MKKFLLGILSCAVLIGQADAMLPKRAASTGIHTMAAALPTSMNNMLSASYDPQDDAVADYYMIISDRADAGWSKEDGPKVADGYVLRLDCYAPLSGKPVALAEGTYTPSADYTAMTYDPDFSYLQYYDASGNGSTEYLLTGNVTVAREANGTYTITAGVQGGTTVTFNGAISFDDGTLPPGVFNQIKSNLDLELNGALAIYDGNLYESNTGSMYINLYDHGFNPETGGMTEDGFSLALQVFGKLFQDSKTATLDPGTYTVGTSFKRFSWYPGTEIEYMGMTGIMGCYAKERNPGRYDDGFAYSYLTDGTIVIEDAGEGVFRITVDAVTSYGHTVKGTFEGTVPVIDKSSSNTHSALSTLEDDVELDLSPIPVCRAFNNGTVNGNQVLIVDIGSPAGRDDITEGDIIRMEFVLAGGSKYLKEGTYTVMGEKWDNYYEPYKLGKGRFVSASTGGSDLSGTRYMHFEEGRTLVMDNYAPADEGTVSVTQNADETWTFNIHLIDDAQFRIDGDWTGPMILMYDPEAITSIGNISADEEQVSLRWLDRDSFSLVGAADQTAAEVYNIQGMRVNALITPDAISLEGMPAGIYIVKYKSLSFKIAKK